LHRWEQFLFIARMHSKVTLALGMALAGIAFCCFVESSLAQDALTTPIAASDNDDVDGEDTDSKDEKSAGAAAQGWQPTKHEGCALDQRK
jgi:hypothetical protein